MAHEMDPKIKIAVMDALPAGWESLVTDCEWGSFYHSRANLRLVEAVAPVRVVCLVARDGVNSLVGGIVFGVQDGPLGPVVNGLPFFGSYGDAVRLTSASPDVEHDLYTALRSYCQSIDALCLTIITSPFADAGHHLWVRECISPTFVDERCCQVVNLPVYAGEGRDHYADTVLSGMEGRARTAYRKILKSSLQLGRVETEAEAMAFAASHRENIEGKGGIFKTEAFFKFALALAHEAPGQAELAVMRDGSRIAGGVVLFYFKDMVEYHTTCLCEEYRSIGPLNRIIVERMIDAGMNGCRFWNFGGTWKSQVGVYQFKRSFGSRDCPYYYFTRYFRDVEKVKALLPTQIVRDYPLCFVIPFAELEGGR